jgi:hypothetical protein
MFARVARAGLVVLVDPNDHLGNRDDVEVVPTPIGLGALERDSVKFGDCSRRMIEREILAASAAALHRTGVVHLTRPTR